MANAITLSRFPLLFAYVILLYYGNSTLLFWGVPILVFLILMDTFDGQIARASGKTSLLGSALDIAADRVVEIILWFVFSDLGLISIVLPLIVVTRGTLTDTFRAVGNRQGVAAFDQIQGKVARFLVSSRTMRTGYAFSKGFAFGFLNLSFALQSAGSPFADPVHIAALILSYLAVAICIARGLPVIIEGFKYL